EVSRKEGGKIFDSGSRATVAVIFFVKDKDAPNHTIFYYEKVCSLLTSCFYLITSL
ncbi:hypothetical protein HMPREF1403_00541, partial [Helicobacter pylori GAM201Ai]